MSAIRILYLEDNPDDVELARHALAHYGQACTWSVANNSVEFFAALARGPYDLILSDQLVPGIDGLGALEAALVHQPNVPFVYLSGGHLLPRQAVANMLAGAADQISKDELWRLVPILGRARERRAHLALTRQAQADGRLVGARLEAAQSTLEAFAACLSHDLRAIEQHSHRLAETRIHNEDEAAPDGLEKIRSISQQALQRVAAARALVGVDRAARHPVEVDLSRLAQAILAELRAGPRERAVEAAVAEGLTAQGDPVLLRSLLANLLGHACRNALAAADARIEFGTAPQRAGAPTFVVRDNGGSFDAAEAHAYFVPFRYPPTDSGVPDLELAIAQRIVQRHAGQIWAEAAPGRGVAVFFTLPHGEAAPPG